MLKQYLLMLAKFRLLPGVRKQRARCPHILAPVYCGLICWGKCKTGFTRSLCWPIWQSSIERPFIQSDPKSDPKNRLNL